VTSRRADLRPPINRTGALFVDRADAGRRLARLLEALPLFAEHSSRPGRPVVVGMARGGVPVAAEVARILDCPLDVVVVRKLGHPGQPELGLGALGEDGVRLVNESLVARLAVPADVIEEVARREQAELDRRVGLYRGDRPPVVVTDRPVIVVDDGLATGFTARAAVEVVRRRGASPVIVAVPAGSPEAVATLRLVADDVVCLETTDRFFGISQWYADFDQVADDEVARLLIRQTTARPTTGRPTTGRP
jgi:putative phosphoribosyl transferase